jgi:hypothetical protein
MSLMEDAQSRLGYRHAALEHPRYLGDCVPGHQIQKAFSKRSACRLGTLAAAALFALGTAHAVPVTWVGPTNGFWDVLGNWNPGLPSPTSDVSLGAFNTEFRTGGVTVQSFTGTGRLTISGGTLATLSASSVGALTFTGGVLDGPGAVTISGPTVWTGGQMASSAPGGNTTFNGAVALSGNGFRDITARTVNFAGTTTWDNTPGGGNAGRFRTGSGATLNNSGTWLDQNSASNTQFTNDFGGAQSTFNNTGSYVKSGSANTVFGIVFNNPASGALNVNAGTLVLGAGGTSTGSVNVAAGATLNVSGGTYNISGLTAGSGTGQLLVTGGVLNANGSNSFAGTVNLSAGSLVAGGTFNAANLNFSGGVLDGPGAVTISGPTVWTGGQMASSAPGGNTTFNGAVALSGNGFRDITARTVNFAGTTTWDNTPGGGNAGRFRTGSGATLNNSGTWLDQNSASNTQFTNDFGGAQSTFNNTGSYVKSGSAATDMSGINVTNTGTINVQQGVLRLPTVFGNAGRIMGNGTVTSTTLTNSGHIAPGESPGTLTLTGSFVQTAVGFFDVELQTNDLHDLFVVSGSATLGGTLDLICFASCAITPGQSIKILDAAPNLLTGSFANVVVTGFAPGSFTVIYDRVNGDVLLNAAAVPEPSAWVMLLAGGIVMVLLRRRQPLSE